MNRALACLMLLCVLAGCSEGVGHALGLVRDTPDEFAVTTRAPLSMPTDDSLPTPEPGAPRPQEPAAQLAAEATLAPAVELNNRTGALTAGQQALIAAAGPPAPANIRATIDAEAKRVNSNAGFTNRLEFWAPTPPPGQVIDPIKESARLRALAASQP
jgi:hypothetical protein